jgi:hypothetical protein
MQHQRGEKVIFAVSNCRPILSFPSQTCLEMASIQSPPSRVRSRLGPPETNSKKEKPGGIRRSQGRPCSTLMKVSRFLSTKKVHAPPFLPSEHWHVMIGTKVRGEGAEKGACLVAYAYGNPSTKRPWSVYCSPSVCLSLVDRKGQSQGG